MDEKITLRSFENESRILLQLADRVKEEEAWNKDGSDPLDCSSLVIPPLHNRIRETLDKAVKEWEDLDARKIGEQDPLWYTKHVRLPDHFDYETKGEPPTGGGKVLDLMDSTKTESYAENLWHLFQRVPTVEQLQQWDHQLPQTAAVLEEVAMIQEKHPHHDVHGMARFRMSSCDPPLPSPPDAPLVATLRLELWHDMVEMKRGSSPEPRRCVVEFMGSQTLKDVHDYIRTELRIPDGVECLFFLENIFYANDRETIQPILNWLQKGCKDERKVRCLQLGLTLPLQHKTLDTLLMDLPLRLGRRYLYRCGTTECSVYATDRRMTRKANEYPVVHDMWAHVPPVCDACRKATTFVVQRVQGFVYKLCVSCARSNDEAETMPYDDWRRIMEDLNMDMVEKAPAD